MASLRDFFGKLLGRKRAGVCRTSDGEITPDEIFLDSHNLPEFDRNQFEGRLEKRLPKRNATFVGIVFVVIALISVGKLWQLQIADGPAYAARSQANQLAQTTLFSDRGVIYDRNGVPLAWNEAASSTSDFATRQYADIAGMSSILGYVKYPSKDSSGVYYNEDYVGTAGVEQYFNDELKGQNGEKLVETDASGNVQSEGVLEPPVAGKNITLTIDSRLQSQLYQYISSLAAQAPFSGGAGVIMDVKTGDIIADVNYPEYDSETMTDGTDTPAIQSYLSDADNPFLNRVSDGLYTPGSIVKPFIAMGALTEGVITPDKKILSTGSISLPNPYHPDQPSIFKDWRAQGWVDMVHAIAYSSDVYFYEVGGGYQDQPGLGIDNIGKYTRMFGFGSPVPSPFFSGSSGTIPSPAWKAANFDGEAWNIGDTYHTAIGQYGFQVSPIQIVRAYSAIANEGTMPEPRISEDEPQLPATTLPLAKSNFDVVQAGMRASVDEAGTAAAMDVSYINIAGKTGTAQLGVSKDFDNSWTVGFFPFENPEYDYAVVMEHGAATNLIGASFVMREMFDWMHTNTPEYLTTATSSAALSSND